MNKIIATINAQHFHHKKCSFPNEGSILFSRKDVFALYEKLQHEYV